MNFLSYLDGKTVFTNISWLCISFFKGGGGGGSVDKSPRLSPMSDAGEARTRGLSVKHSTTEPLRSLATALKNGQYDPFKIGITEKLFYESASY